MNKILFTEIKNIIKQCIKNILLQDYLDKYKQVVINAIGDGSNPQKTYIDLVVNNPYQYNQMLKVMQRLYTQKKLSPEFIKKFEQVKKNYSQKLNGDRLIAKIDGFELYDEYNQSLQHQQLVKKAKICIHQAAQQMQNRGYSLALYGRIMLRQPQRNTTLAQYSPNGDYITLRIYKQQKSNQHIVTSLVHQIRHRIWFVLMNQNDHAEWWKEWQRKLSSATIKFNRQGHRGLSNERLGPSKHGRNYSIQNNFPKIYAATNVQEYFAVCVQYYVCHNQKYSNLLDEVI